MTRPTDATIGLLIANAARQGIITRADAEKVAAVFGTIGMACQAEIDRGDIDEHRWRRLMHRGQVCEGIRRAIEDRLNGGPKLKDKETEG